MIYDEDTMNATERALSIIKHEKPDRVSTYTMNIQPYSLCHKEYIEREDEIFDFDNPESFGSNENNILITPLGDHTEYYYFGADIMM